MISSLPSDWGSVLVPAALDEERPIIRPSAKIAARDYRPSGRFPIIDQSQNAVAGWTDDEQAVLQTPRPVVVFGDHSRTFKYVDAPFAAGADGTLILNPSADFEPKFLYFACLNLEIPSRGYNRHYTLLKEISVPKPPLAEQLKIASVLGKAQAAVEVEGELIRVTRELKQAALRQLFTRGLRGEPQKQTDLGPTPESWAVVPLSVIASFASGGTPSKSEPDNWGGAIPWVSPKDMKRPRLADAIDHITEKGLAAGSRLVPAGAILVVIRGMILMRDVPVALTMVPVAFNQDMKAILPGPRVRPEFLLYAFEAFRPQLFSRVGTSAHGTRTLASSALENFEIPLPAEPEQREIAAHLAAIDAKLAHHEARRALLRELFRTLLRDLMTARRRVHGLNIDGFLSN